MMFDCFKEISTTTASHYEDCAENMEGTIAQTMGSSRHRPTPLVYNFNTTPFTQRHATLHL